MSLVEAQETVKFKVLCSLYTARRVSPYVFRSYEVVCFNYLRKTEARALILRPDFYCLITGSSYLKPGFEILSSSDFLWVCSTGNSLHPRCSVGLHYA
jgi:hypothetical protein